MFVCGSRAHAPRVFTELYDTQRGVRVGRIVAVIRVAARQLPGEFSDRRRASVSPEQASRAREYARERQAAHPVFVAWGAALVARAAIDPATRDGRWE